MAVVEIYKTICSGRNTESLIESMCFYMKVSRFHVFSNYSQVRMFCNDNRLKLVPEPTRSGFSLVVICS